MQLFHRKLGEKGQPLVILHGLFGSSDNWMTVAKQLAENHQVYLLDLRNHGQSPWSEEWNYEVMSEDILAFLEAQAIEDCVMVGHSMGGKVAMLFAGKYPSKLDKLIVVDIAPRFYAVHHDGIIEALQGMDLSKITSRSEAESELAKSIHNFGTRQFLLKNLYRPHNGGFAWRINLEVIDRKIDEVGVAFPENLSFDKSTLFVRGSESDYIQDTDEVMIKQFFPNAAIQTIQDAGHWVHAEKPQELLALMRDFID